MASKKQLIDGAEDAACEKIKPVLPGKEWRCSTRELLQLFGVSYVTIAKYVNNGMPKVRMGVYSVKHCLDWWLENIYKSKAEERDDSMTEHKRRYWKEKADQIELQNAAQRKEYIKRHDVESGLAELVVNLRGSLLSWPSRVFPNDNELRAKLRNEVNLYLEGLSENKIIVAAEGKPAPKKRKAPAKKPARKPTKKAKR